MTVCQTKWFPVNALARGRQAARPDGDSGVSDTSFRTLRVGMIAFTYGTTGELIKLLPVMRRLREHGHQYLSITTGQQCTQIPPLLDALKLPPPDVWLARGAGGRDLRTTADLPRWLATVLGSYAQQRGHLRRRLTLGAGRPLVVVHGDTMTTVLGALMGRSLGVKVAHVESGLRSFDLRHPFPEEMNRRVVSQLAHIHYAPGAWAAGNLHRGCVVDTGSNTIRDSLRLCVGSVPSYIDLPDRPFGVVSLHRFELLSSRELFTSTLELLAAHARAVPLLFVEHAVTVAAIERYGLQPLFMGGLRRIQRLPFCDFVALERRSSFLVTDSGGSQEEAYYLDIPCAVHRSRTERREGLEENVVLTGYSLDALRRFLEDPSRYRRRQALPDAAPSDVIAGDLEARGFAA